MQERNLHIPVRIAFIGGGSLNWAHTLMQDLAFDTNLSADVRIYDVDFDASTRNSALGARFASISNGTPAVYTAASTLEEALDKADIVIISILPGTFDCMGHDIQIPATFGIPQAVGDTVGPGGFSRALRAIPMFVEIAQAIRKTAPKAHVCNLTNPMSVLTGTLYKVFPEICAWGECHEVSKIRRQVAWIANQREEHERFSFRDVSVNVLGINHFTFVDRISLNGKDMMPDYKEFVAEHTQKGWLQTEPGKDAEHARYFGSSNLVAFDIFNRFGVPAAAGDRHLAEFFPVDEYLDNCDKWGFALTPVDYRVRDRLAKKNHVEKMVKGALKPQAKRSDEAILDQIISIMGGGSFISNVNLPNRGQLSGLPDGAIVETNAVFRDSGIDPLCAGKLPDHLLKIVAHHSARQSALVDAVLNHNADELFDIFRNDPLVAQLSDREARSMIAQLIEATVDYIPVELRGAA